ncbi:MAG TPA: hypothetical protein DCE41_09385 [Cytophagales bacterium]|nr:hypothetical protein [Cytophagales bacterium]
MRNLFTLALLVGIFSACQSTSTTQEPTTSPVEENPSAAGFNQEDSDPKAIALADSVMKAMGGREAWDKTRYLSWNFFGRRTHHWDRYTGQIKIESPGDTTVYWSNVISGGGRVTQGGVEVTDSTQLADLLERARRIWINDSYWLVMPYKLKDTGVTLTYKGMAPTQDSVESHVLVLNFDGVGVTPENRYEVYVDPESHLVTQWDFYRSAADTVAGFQTPWKSYQPFGDILLSGDRGQFQLTVYDAAHEVPEGAFGQ